MVAAEIDGVVVDKEMLMSQDSNLRVITKKDKEYLEILRHSTAHLMAQAVKRLYPEAKVAIGPVIEDGFYYDFYCPKSFNEDDIEKIERKMQEIISEDYKIIRSTFTREEAIKFFTDIQEDFKVEIIDSIPDVETLSVYTQGEFADLCLSLIHI